MHQETQTEEIQRGANAVRNLQERSRRNAPIDLEAEENKPVRAFLVGVATRVSNASLMSVCSPVSASKTTTRGNSELLHMRP